LQRKKSQETGPPATAPVQPNKSGEEDLKKLGQEICDPAAGCWLLLLYKTFWVGIFEFCDELVGMDDEQKNSLRMGYIHEFRLVSIGLIRTTVHLEMHGQYRHVQAYLCGLVHENLLKCG